MAEDNSMSKEEE